MARGVNPNRGVQVPPGDHSTTVAGIAESQAHQPPRDGEVPADDAVPDLVDRYSKLAYPAVCAY
jgi:hypothetical protein